MPPYNRVIKISDELTRKMIRLDRMKNILNDSIGKNPEMTMETKSSIEQSVLQLDSAYKAIGIWKALFNPPNPSDKEAFDKYSEAELVKVKEIHRRVSKIIEANKNLMGDNNSSTEVVLQ